ncbi:endo-beta-N-acetylglucosaminidase [Streptomyces sp. NBC_01728]|uniref:endo-beta-N-acetylglucosaminidase n=1 Tax=unclassified Streptomyces TaxID=2593676 RepID=UPI0022507AEB|nr:MULTISPECIES: endo-beta-N-acetylglucosaminidase [unclassified Streptomyces]MCX4452176.1 endo-beta-N-acetylglucosaminidase [Streptomyces sp. NBC_01719]MCX4491536.1 endo-beta-N-acetylglucosaminidase [Streptomyces sp. NBC_01728]
MNPTRRTVLLAGATAALLPALPGLPAAAATKAAATAASPYASYWYPDSLPSGTPGTGITWHSLKAWSAATDTDLAFNASTVPLAARFTPTPANTTARSGQARVQSLVSFGPTSSNPSQGAATADYYALTHWAYLDELVFWGGSAGEGLILAPNAPIVDAAHRHGVRVLGNVFLPPVAYGGQLQWTRDLVQKDSTGHYPLAAQLVAVAAAYGFDGWFINAETSGGNTSLATDMLGFMNELKTLGTARGQRVTWYDAMTVNGSVSWQGALNSQNKTFFQAADSMFVDFRWSQSGLASSATTAQQLGRSPYELWAGVDVEANGTSASVNWDAIVPSGKAHVTSLGFYRPEWTRNHLPASRTPGDFHAADDLFWTGSSLDPSKPSTSASWRAPAVCVADRSTVTSVPFATTFNTGHGLKWYEDGEATSDTAWNHLGLQDRLPSRRWVVRTTGQRPAVTFDFADAWRGGSSLVVAGALDAPTTLDLYATRLPLTADTVVELTYRTDAGAAAVELAVATAEPGAAGGAPPYTYFPVTSSGDGWGTATVPLTGLTGTVHALGVRLTASSGPVRWRVGGLAVRDAVLTPAAPTDLRVTGADGGNLRFAWQGAPGAVRHYELYRTLPDGTRWFLGGTCQIAFYVGGLTPEQGESAGGFEVRAVGELFTVSTAATTTHTW